MKRLTVILVLMMYLTMNCGLVINSHFCGGKLASLSLFDFDDNKCQKCGVKMAKDCCKNTATKLSIEDEQQSARSIVLTITEYTNFFTPVTNASFEQTPAFAILNLNSNRFYAFETGPPKTPIYIQVRSLLI